MLSVKYLLIAMILLGQWVEEIRCVRTDNLPAKYTRLLKIRTGYPKEEPNLDISNLTPADIKTLKRKVSHALTCNHLYSGLLYVWLTRSVLENGKEFEKVNKISKYFSDLATEMITFMRLNAKRSELDRVWWNYMYAMYFEKMVSGEIKYNQETVSSFCLKIEKGLSDSVRDKVCDENNNFNDQLIAFGKQNSEYLSKRRFVAINNLIDTISGDLKWNAGFSSSNLSSNTHTGFAIKQTDMDQKVLLLGYIMRTFGDFDDIDVTLRKMVINYRQIAGSEDFEETFKGLAKYQSEFISILKIVMLQIIKKHIQYIIECLRTSNKIFFPESCVSLLHDNATVTGVIMKMSTQLHRFLKFLDIRSDDDDFVTVLSLFQHSVFKSTDFRNALIEIVKTMPPLSRKLEGCKLIFTKPNDEEHVKQSLKNIEEETKRLGIMVDEGVSSEILPFKDSLTRATVFVDFLVASLKDTDFGIIQSFIRFSGMVDVIQIDSENEEGDSDKEN